MSSDWLRVRDTAWTDAESRSSTLRPNNLAAMSIARAVEGTVFVCDPPGMAERGPRPGGERQGRLPAHPLPGPGFKLGTEYTSIRASCWRVTSLPARLHSFLALVRHDCTSRSVR
jgi:hypothetical protein